MTNELKEKINWQMINSSKNKGRILEGKIIAATSEKINNEEINYAIIDFQNIKVIIPATDMIPNGRNDKKIIRNMMGSKIKFIVIEVDKIGEKAIGSRNKAEQKIRDINFKKLVVGDIVEATVIGVWHKFIRLECLGFDFIFQAQDLQYGFIDGVSKLYKINDKIKVVIKQIDEENQKIKISIKDLIEDPYKNIRKDYTEKGEYLAKITTYTDKGIFANIAQGIDTICSLPDWLERPPLPGDVVVVRIGRIIPESRKIYSTVVKVIGNDENE